MFCGPKRLDQCFVDQNAWINVGAALVAAQG